MKIKKKSGEGGQGEYERRFEVFVKMEKKKFAGDLGRGVRFGGSGRISEVFVKILKKIRAGHVESGEGGGGQGWMLTKK